MSSTVDSLAAKLGDLYDRATPEEQEVLATLLAMAEWAPRPEPEPDVEGFIIIVGGKPVDAQDRLANFGIQDLMSRYNQAQQLASSVLKKRDQTANGIIGNI